MSNSSKITACRKEPVFMVYSIRCHVTGKQYIGSTSDSLGRMNHHFGMLRRNKHHSIKLQNAWNKYGEEAFDFDVCEYGFTAEEIRSAELFWIKTTNSFHDGYNMTDYVGQGTSIPTEQRLKMSVTAQKVGKRVTIKKKRSELAKAMHNAGKLGQISWKPGTVEIVANKNRRARPTVAKLSDATVNEIKHFCTTLEKQYGKICYVQVAKKYNISPCWLRKLLSGEARKYTLQEVCGNA